MLNEISGNEPQTYSVLENNADGIELPDGVDLQSANFVRDGSDLLIQSADEGNFTVNNYFSNETLADIVSGDGHIMSGNAFDTLSDAAAHNQVAQAQIPGLEVATSNEPGTQVRGEPIGSVDNAEGVVSVTHVDGTTETLNVGDKVYQGDVLVTESGAGVGITLADTSVFSLGEEGELVLDELVYDPGQMEGSAVLSLLQGTATYVSGQIAKINPDAVQITTPVATIGIRGTKVFVEYNDGNFRTINMLETTENGEVPGEIVVYDINGTPLGSTNQANIGWSWNSNDNTPPNARQFSSHDVDTITRENLRHLPKSIIEKSIENQDNQQASLGQAHKEDGAQQDHGYKDTVVDVNDGHDIDYQDIIVQNVHSTTITSITPIIVDDENIPIKETETETETEIKLTVPKDDTTSTLHGTAIDGYLNGSTVFVDLNKDGVLDDNESNRTTTDSNGKFNLTIPTDQTDYIISVVGGEDMATNAEFYGSLQTVAGATVITPLTTLLANGVSKAQLVSIFGIDANIDITQNDPIALSKSGDNVAAYSRIAAVGVQIQNTIIQAASIFEGAAIGGVDDGFAANKLFNAIASAIKESNFDITNTDNLETIITNAAAEIPGVDTSKVASSAATAAQLISTSNTSIKAQIDAGLTGDALLNFVTQEQVSATSLAEKMTTTISNGQTLNNALISTDEDTTKTITLTLNEGQSVSIETQPAHGNVIVNENGSITYTPGENYNGDDSFTYTITSGEEVIKTVPVNIQVKAVNDAPVTSSSPVIAGTEDTALLITKAQLLAKTTDPEGDTITLSDVSAASGTLVDNGDDTWTYTPVANATGNVTINFTVSDGTDTANAT
ncbi:MAG: cadherin-like domain-containing protein, partial [Methylocystaceae bacterium]|nr:cadherin-like domain-containing protein [Methylocystaceae bacterium]